MQGAGLFGVRSGRAAAVFEGRGATAKLLSQSQPDAHYGVPINRRGIPLFVFKFVLQVYSFNSHLASSIIVIKTTVPVDLKSTSLVTLTAQQTGDRNQQPVSPKPNPTEPNRTESR